MDGKVALVTGGGSGIGAATVALLRARGATVVAGDLENGDVHLDVTDEASVHEVITGIVAEHGRLDLAANVAGTSGTYATLAETDLDAWRHTMRINLDGVFLSLRAELRAGARSIVNVASSAGRMGVPGLGAYCASKHGVIGLTRTAALETAKHGVRVNCVCPGSTRTPMLAAFVGGDEHALEGMGRRAPMGRLGAPTEIAEAIVWLLSDASSYLTGSVVEADGGVAAV